MRTFQIILADDEQQILHGMERGIDWEGLGFSVAERHRTEKKRWNSWKNITRIW